MYQNKSNNNSHINYKDYIFSEKCFIYSKFQTFSSFSNVTFIAAITVHNYMFFNATIILIHFLFYFCFHVHLFSFQSDFKIISIIIKNILIHKV